MRGMSASRLIEAAAACTVCGEEHKPRRIGEGFATNASPRDGHFYRPRLHAMTGMAAGPFIAALRQLAEEGNSAVG